MLDQFRELPKADLHVHLEGTVTPKTLQLLAKKNKVSLSEPTVLPGYPPIPAPKPESTHGYFRGDFREFIRLYVKISSTIQSADDLLFVAESYLQSAIRENILAAEIYVTPSTLLSLGLSEDDLCRGLTAAESLAQSEYKMRLGWIFDIVRNSPAPGEQTVEVAERVRKGGANVIAVGLAGLEAGYPATPFRSSFELARKLGFRVYAHAGETAGAESIRETLECIAPDRIGHGIRVLDDPALLDEIKARNIPLEVCPWSNIALGVTSEAAHPLVRLVESGLPVVLASDDPGIFGKSLAENYFWAHTQGLSVDELRRVAARSLELAGYSSSSSAS
ncbi:MAG: adenosine deaminase [Bdellovibrionota bacterium]